VLGVKTKTKRFKNTFSNTGPLSLAIHRVATGLGYPLLMG